MKKILLGLMLGMMLVCFIGLTSAGSEQVLNMSIVDGLFDDSVIESGVWMNGTWNGAWWSNPWKYVKGDILTKNTLPSDLEDEMYYTRYFEDPVIEKPSKPDGSACITEWVCENGVWIKADWMHPKRVESCITNYNEKNCAVAERYWNRIIPGEKCFVLNDNGIGLKEKPTGSCVKETIQVEQQTSEDKQEQPVIVPEKKKGFWNWFKGLFN